MNERQPLPPLQRLVRKLPIGARIGLAGIVGAGSLGLAACGPARGGEQVQPPPAAPAQASELSSPTAVPTVAPTEAPKPTATPKIELSADAPQEVKAIFSGVEKATPKFTASEVARQYQQALQEAATYTNPNRPPAIVEAQRAGKYGQIFSSLVAQYYATRDLEILALAQQLRAFIKEKYPAFYAAEPASWEIQGEGK